MSDQFYYTVEDGEVPPSYFEAISPNSLPQYASLSASTQGGHGPPTIASGSGSLLPSSLTTSFTSPLTTHLHDLPIRMRANQQARSTEQATRDFEVITLLVPHIEKFLSDLGSRPRTPPVAELTLVPGNAVPRGAAMSGAAERRREGEVVRVVRVEAPPTKRDPDSKTGGSGNGSSSEKGGIRRSGFDDEEEDGYEDEEEGPGRWRAESGFDEWGRFDTDETLSARLKDLWFFCDEAMAQRLANYLRPEPNLDRRHIQAVVENKPSPTLPGNASSNSGQSGWRWGRKKQAQQAAPAAPVSPASPLLSAGETEHASMTVRAEEVTFRTENEFGIYESLRGYGIVVTVKIRR